MAKLKQQKMNLMLKGWQTTNIGSILKLNYGKGLPEGTRAKGVVPVYGSNGIVGFHSKPLIDSEGIIIGRKGSVGLVHYSKVPFYPIDTTYYISPEDTDLPIDYLYYLLLHKNLASLKADVGVPGLNRNMAYFEDIKFTDNPTEHFNISHILSTLQKAIEKQQQIIATTQALKKSLLHELFTKGTKGEKLKETEIGMIPESWEIMEIGKIFKFTSGKPRPKNIVKYKTSKHTFPVYGGNGILGFSSEYSFDEPKLILGRVGEYCGCSHITDKYSWISDNALYAKDILMDVYIEYFKYFFDHFDLNRFSNKNGQPLITQGGINALLVSLPIKNEQIEISNSIKTIDKKINLHKYKMNNYECLFKSLLNELMTGSIRVDKIDFNKTSKL